MLPNAARIARQQEAARNVGLLVTALALAPRLADPRHYDPPNVGVSSDTRCWDVKLLDQFGKPRDAFLRGPSTIAEASERANDLFKNWTILAITPSRADAPPDHARPVPAAASEYGVMKSLDARRRR